VDVSLILQAQLLHSLLLLLLSLLLLRATATVRGWAEAVTPKPMAMAITAIVATHTVVQDILIQQINIAHQCHSFAHSIATVDTAPTFSTK
jgi:hypothetical protein